MGQSGGVHAVKPVNTSVRAKKGRANYNGNHRSEKTEKGV